MYNYNPATVVLAIEGYFASFRKLGVIKARSGNTCIVQPSQTCTNKEFLIETESLGEREGGRGGGGGRGGRGRGPPLENCARIQSAMWTKLGSSDCMKRRRKSTAEGLPSSSVAWYSSERGGGGDQDEKHIYTLRKRTSQHTHTIHYTHTHILYEHTYYYRTKWVPFGCLAYAFLKRLSRRTHTHPLARHTGYPPLMARCPMTPAQLYCTSEWAESVSLMRIL